MFAPCYSLMTFIACRPCLRRATAWYPPGTSTGRRPAAPWRTIFQPISRPDSAQKIYLDQLESPRCFKHNKVSIHLLCYFFVFCFTWRNLKIIFCWQMNDIFHRAANKNLYSKENLNLINSVKKITQTHTIWNYSSKKY